MKYSSSIPTLTLLLWYTTETTNMQLITKLPTKVQDTIDQQLYKSVMYNKYGEVQNLIQNYKPNLSKTNTYQNTLLHFAALHPTTEILQLLLNHGLVNKKNSLGNTPLDWAKKNNNQSAIALLEQHENTRARNVFSWYFNTKTRIIKKLKNKIR